MRNAKTPWNRAYTAPAVDTTADFARQLVSKRRERVRSEAQQEIKKRWDQSFEIRTATIRAAKHPHADDIALGLSRRHAEEKQEDFALEEELREVWE